jgi:hypothetical protein
VTLRGLLAALTVIALAAPSSSAAQNSGGFSGVFFPPTPTTILSETQVPLRETGSLTVNFAGAQSAGCATHGVCPYGGRIDVFPTSGSLLIFKVRRHHHVTYELTGLGGESGFDVTPTATARVDRALSGGGVARCTDSVSSLGLDLPFVGGASPNIQVLGANTELLATRCAGPTDGDVAAAVPHRALAAAVAERGETSLDLSGNAQFAGGGFVGTVSSTIVVRLGRAQHLPIAGGSGDGFPRGIKLVKVRSVDEALTLTHASGEIDAEVSGVADGPVCSLLDSCGLTGTVALKPRAADDQGTLDVTAPARLPKREFLAALGRAGGRRAGGFTGDVPWQDTSRPVVRVSQDGNTCSASAPPGNLALEIDGDRASFLITLMSYTSLRSECPGPFLNNTDTGDTLAQGIVPRSLFGHRNITVRLHSVGELTDDGYVIRPRGALTIRLRAGRITQHLGKLPPGF